MAKEIRRKLTTILAADVVGYSRLMATDEEASLDRLKAYREVIDDLIARHNGRIFNTAGDAVLAEFISAVEAVRCAIAIQEELAARNSLLPAELQMALRIGVNVGDVIIDGEDLFGDGVNVAARLEGLAQPGGICISGSTFEQVKNKLSIGFEDLGPQEVKNIPYPVAAFRVRSGSVSVVVEPTGAGRLAGTPASSPRPRRVQRRLVGGALVVVLAVGAVAVWLAYPRGPVPITSFPSQASTDSLRAGEIEALVTGMAIEGVRAVDGQPFSIRLNADKTAHYEFGRPGALRGAVQRETGRWRVEDYTFCMQFRRFNEGREACPRIVKDGSRVFATRADGTRLGWTLSRER